MIAALVELTGDVAAVERVPDTLATMERHRSGIGDCVGIDAAAGDPRAGELHIASAIRDGGTIAAEHRRSALSAFLQSLCSGGVTANSSLPRVAAPAMW